MRETLSEPTPATEVLSMAADAGITKKTLRRASESLGIIKQKTGMKTGWVWSLPPKMRSSSEDAQHDCMGSFGELGPLREPLETVGEVDLWP